MILGFSDFEIDTSRHALYRAGEPVHVEPQVFDLIVCLAQRSGSVVSKDELVAEVWKGLAVSDATINARISAARKALNDDGRQQNVIRTIHKRGFQFCPAINVLQSALQETAPAQEPHSTPARQASPINYTRSQDGAAIAWARTGRGPTVVRLAHWMSHLELDLACPVWSPMISALEAQNTLLRYDLRGTAMSQRDVRLDGLDRYVNDLAAVLDASGDGPACLFAASQAVPVAVAFAHRFPEKVIAMVLYGGACEGRMAGPKQADALDMETALSLVRSAWGQHGSVFQDAFNRLFMPEATPNQIDSFARTQREAADTETAVELRLQVDHFNVTDILHETLTPALVIHAQHDAIQPISEAQTLAAGLPNAQLMVLDSRNHVPIPQDPAWASMMSAAQAFFDQHTARV